MALGRNSRSGSYKPSGKGVSLQGWSDKDGDIDSPRSSKAMARLGFTMDDFRPRSAGYYVERGFPATEAKVRSDRFEEKRLARIQRAGDEYQEIIRMAGAADSGDLSPTQQLAQKLSTAANRRDERTQTLIQKKQFSTARLIINEIKTERTHKEREEERMAKEAAREERMAAERQAMRERNEKKRLEAEAAVERVHQNEIQNLEQRRKDHQERLKMIAERQAAHDELNRTKADEKRKKLDQEDQHRRERKRKADQDEEDRKNQGANRVETQEQNRQRILGERAEAQRVRSLNLKMRSQEVQEAVGRREREMNYKKEATMKRVREKAERAEEMARHRDKFVHQSREISRQEAEAKHAIAQWIALIKLTGEFSVPEWLDLDLNQYKEVFEAEFAANPNLPAKQIREAIESASSKASPKGGKKRKHASRYAPSLQAREPVYFAKWMFED